MKKLLYLLSLGALFTFCACTDDDDSGSTSGDLAQVTFTLETTGGIETRAYSDGLTATYLVYGVYDSETKELVDGLSQTTAVSAFSNKEATVELYLPKGGSYTIVFWAQAENPPYEVNLENKTVTLKGDTDDDGALTVDGNDETMDAFYATVETGTVTGNYSESVTLKRPFAQVNIGVDDLTAYQASDKDVKYTKMVVTGAGNTMNLLDGSVTFDESTAGGTVIYDWASVDECVSNSFPYEEETDEDGNVISPTTKDGEYTYLAMNYVFVGADMTTVDVEFYFSESAEEEDNHSVSVSSVPIQRNYRTNIYGSLLTGTFTYKLEIDKDYDGVYNNMISVSTWDDLQAALSAGYGAILTADITASDDYTTVVSSDATIDLNGYTITFSSNSNSSRLQVTDEADVTITNGTLSSSYWAVVVNAAADVTLDDVTITSTGSSYPAVYLASGADDATVTINDCKIESASYAVYAAGATYATVTVENSTLTSSSYAVTLSSSSTGVTFEATGSTITSNNTYGRAINSSAADATITLTDTEVNSTYLGIYATGSGTTITATDTEITGITYGVYATGSGTTITLTDTEITPTYLGIYATGSGTTITANNVTVTGTTGVHSAYYVNAENATVSVTGGSVSSADYYGVNTWGSANTVSVSGTTFTDCGYSALAVFGDNSTLTVEGCTIKTTQDDDDSVTDGILIGQSAGKSTGITATVTSTTIDVSSQTYGVGIQVYGYNEVITVDECTITHNYFGITQDGTSTPGSSFTVKNSTITGPYTGIYLSMSTTSEYYNTLNVSGSTIISTESTPIEVKKTYLTVSSSKLTSQYTGEDDGSKQQDYSMYGSGSAGAGYGIVLAGYKTGQAYSYDFTDFDSAVNLSDITYTLSVQYAMDGKSEPWYVLQYMGYEENSTNTDYSAEYTDDGATDSSSYGSSETSSAPRHRASSRGNSPQLKNHEVKAKQVSKNQLITL